MPVTVTPAVPFAKPHVVMEEDAITFNPPVMVTLALAVAEQPPWPDTVTVYELGDKLLIV